MVTQVVYRVPDIGFVDNRLSLMNQSPQSPSRASQSIRPAMSRLGLPIPQMPFRSNGQVPNGYPMANPAVYPVAYQNGQPQVPAGSPMPPQSSIPAPPAYGHPGSGQSHVAYDMPHLPEYAWPAYASYPNYAQVTYPKEYAASAWPYIGPFYPYPQIPLGWRQVQLEWDDGHWNLNFRPRTDKWWWFLDPENW